MLLLLLTIKRDIANKCRKIKEHNRYYTHLDDHKILRLLLCS
jgi:hypothetical protein